MSTSGGDRAIAARRSAVFEETARRLPEMAKRWRVRVCLVILIDFLLEIFTKRLESI
jgi:hypothetical protein